MSVPQTIAELVAFIHQRDPELALKQRATLSAVNRYTYPVSNVGPVPRPSGARERRFLALLVKYGLDPAAVAALPNVEAREDAVHQALSDALDSAGSGVKANVEILRDAHTVTMLQRQIERANVSLTDPSYGRDSVDLDRPIPTRWIDTFHGGEPVTMDELKAVWP